MPIHVEFAVLDTLENLAPNIIKLKKISDAVDLCKRIIEKEKNGTLKSYEEELEIVNKQKKERVDKGESENSNQLSEEEVDYKRELTEAEKEFD